jgi:2-succinyl-6-hydroxy-2,4-cyclohexadiene-1-carboxylate synthase
MTTAQINGIDINYELNGKGPTLVMAHGLMGSMANASKLGDVSDLMWDDFTVLSYDARGHGLSGFTENPADYSWTSLANDTSALLRHVGIEKAHIAGGSMGAGTSICFALEHPEAVDKLVLIAPPPILPEMGTMVNLVFGGFAGLIESQGLEAATNVAMNLPPISLLRDTDPEMYEWMRGWLMSQNPASLVPAIQGLLTNGEPLPHERFHEITAPTLVVAHPGDDIHPVEAAELVHREIAGSKMIVAPDALYWQGHREELAKAITDFLREP